MNFIFDLKAKTATDDATDATKTIVFNDTPDMKSDDDDVSEFYLYKGPSSPFTLWKFPKDIYNNTTTAAKEKASADDPTTITDSIIFDKKSNQKIDDDKSNDDDSDTDSQKQSRYYDDAYFLEPLGNEPKIPGCTYQKARQANNCTILTDKCTLKFFGPAPPPDHP